MKRYIRTKDGKIIDLNYALYTLHKLTVFNGKKAYYFQDCENGDGHYLTFDQIVKETNTIEELIEVGDFIIAKDNIAYSGLVEEIYLDCCEEKIFNLGLHCFIHYTRIAELYTKQGNNYILVWDKDKGVI